MNRNTSRRENPQQQSTLEFVGGPYDGFLHVLSGDIGDVATEVAVPVSFNLILAAAGQAHGPLLPFRRLATYHLREQQGVLRYAFSGEIFVEADNDEY